MKKTLSILAICLATTLALQAQVEISSNYSQDFNSLGAGLPPGWTLNTAVTATSIGTTGAAFTSTAGSTTAWSDSSGAFKNVASATGLTSSTSVANQTAALDRALGVRTTGAFGDTTKISFDFNFSTVNATVSAISLDAMMVSVQARSRGWTVQYGMGTSPTAWTDLGTYADPGTFGTTPLSYSGFGTALDGQTSVWIRIASLENSTGSGSQDTFAIDNFNITAAAVPEPHEYGLVLTGMLVALMAARRRKGAASL